MENMGSVLSQDEVDALLEGVVSEDKEDENKEEDEYDPAEIISFDLTAQDRIIRGRMPTLEIIHDRFVRLFRLTLSNALITDFMVFDECNIPILTASGRMSLQVNITCLNISFGSIENIDLTPVVF